MEGKMPDFFKCTRCEEQFLPDYDDDGEIISDKLCYHCFEEALEDFEEKRRKRIALQNEY